MGETKNTQKIAKAELDHKLSLASPSREILEDLAVACAKDPSPDNTFQYAFCLSKSTQPSELRYAVTILDGLVKEGYEHQVDCLYGAACALYLLGEYDKSRLRCEQVLRSKPESRLASELHLASIESQERRDTKHIQDAAIGSAMAVAAVGVAAGLVGLLLKR